MLLEEAPASAVEDRRERTLRVLLLLVEAVETLLLEAVLRFRPLFLLAACVRIFRCDKEVETVAVEPESLVSTVALSSFSFSLLSSSVSCVKKSCRSTTV